MTLDDIDEYFRELKKDFALTIVNLTEIVNGQPEYEIVYISLFRDSRKNIYFNKYMDHLSFITKFAPAEKNYSCHACNASFRDLHNHNQHFKTKAPCGGAPINRLPDPGDCVFQKKENPVYRLFRHYGTQEFTFARQTRQIRLHPRSDELAARVDELYKYEYAISFDYEVMFKMTPGPQTNTRYVANHILMSVSLESNIPGHKSCYLFDENPVRLVRRMFDFIDEATGVAGDLMLRKLRPLIEVLQDMGTKKDLHDVIEYATCVPIKEYNNAIYDDNLLKQYGFISKILKRDTGPRVSKHGNQYKVI